MEEYTLQNFRHEASQDPAFRKEYRRLKPFFSIIPQVINRRLSMGLTQKDLAERAGTHQSRISKIESGEHDIRLSTLIAIAEALDVDVEIKLTPTDESSTYTISDKTPVNIGEQEIIPGETPAHNSFEQKPCQAYSTLFSS